jgi:hypothetical protein
MPTPVLVTVTGTISDHAGPVAGRLTFTRSVTIRDPNGVDVIIPSRVIADVGADGLLDVDLFATDDPDFSPVGWTWRVQPDFEGWSAAFDISVPYDAPSAAIDFAELAPVPADGTGDLYALAGHSHAEGGGAGDPAGTAATLDAEHVAAANPHPVYLTETEADALYEPLGGGGGSAMVVKRAKITSGDIIPQNTAGAWALLTGGPTLAIAAAVGDYVQFDIIGGMRSLPSASMLDLAVIVGGAAARYASTGGASPALEGDPTMYPNPSEFLGLRITFEFVVEAGDLSGGNVTFGFACKSNGTGNLYASANYPLRLRAINHGPVSVS